VHAALDTTLYVQVDDLYKAHPERPKIGCQPKITDAELVA
jgi:hypothetical protein